MAPKAGCDRPDSKKPSNAGKPNVIRDNIQQPKVRASAAGKAVEEHYKKMELDEP